MGRRERIAPKDHIDWSDSGRIAAILCCNLLGVALVAAINPALPKIAAHFKTANPAAEFLAELALLLPAILVALGSPLAGWLAGTWGRRPLFLVSAALYGAAGASCLVAPTIESLVAIRLVQGLATAGLVNLAVILGADYFSGAARTRIIGWQAAAINAGAASLLLLSGVLTRTGWQTPFLVYVIGGAMLFGLGMISVVEPVPPAPSDASLEPLPPLVRSAIVLSVLTAMLLFLPPIHVPFLLTGMGFEDPGRIALCLATLNICGMVVAFSFVRIAQRVGFKAIFIVGLLLGAAGSALIATASGPIQVTIGAAAIGATIGLIVPALQNLAITASSERIRPRAISLVIGGTFVGEALSPLLSEPLKRAVGTQGVFGIAAGLFVAGVFATLAVRLPSGKPA